MNYTSNFQLKKPELTDSYNIEDFNENAEKIDEQLFDLSALKNPSFEPSETLSEPESGEGIQVIFGKIKTAISSLINHLSNKNNPHSVTAAQAGAANATHYHSASDIQGGTISISRIPTIPIAQGGTGATTAADALSNIGAQKSLGFTPVRQGGGTDQLDNIIYIGWSGKVLKIQVDATDMGEIVTTGSANGAILPISKGGTGASSAAAAESNIMPASTISSENFVTNIITGSALSGATIKKYGKRINASFIFSNVTSSANGKVQIFKIASAYRTAGAHIGIVNVMTKNSNGTFSRGCGFINAGEKDGIVTIVLPSINTTYNEVEIFMDYYIN